MIITMDENTKRVTQSFVTQVSPSRMFKALILDSHNICPRLLFSSIKSIEYFEGDGDVGTIKQINYIEGGEIRYTKHRVDALDKEKFMCKYRFIEGDGFIDSMLEFLTHEIKFEGYGQGGCVCKITCDFKAKEGVEIKGIDIELVKHKPLGMYEVVEAHLKAYPQLYA
ncbi:hypothetical protein CICLE_v10006074mg [Citrus x clementina]|uniref:Bet v I/Major latex protein domain-containing protein n=1 Tax=Citrus clementina TaxID=85681 RepID=V4S1Y2_CITCL|nr:major allergen Pru ar 1 [Citrus x clementina]ESR32710.1 hypothetical protein CICLE_v10006074mg [Citrus x clementina]GAY35791.1 hypothetical protein CUMW_018570 [Citrus unshiu]